MLTEPIASSGDLPDFAELLALDEREQGRFRGACHDGAPMRAFGGQLAAQAFVAAAKTVPAQQAPASMHAYFAKNALANEPVEYIVSTIRDGNSFSSKSVAAVQHGQTVLVLLASFYRPEDGPDRQQLPAEFAPPLADASEREHSAHQSIADRFVDQQELTAPVPTAGRPGVGQFRRWMRARLATGAEPTLRAGAIIYMADMVLARAALQPHVESAQDRPRATSLDYAVWFHGETQPSAWLLFDASSPVLKGTRALAFAHVYDESGTLVASSAQDVLARQLPG